MKLSILICMVALCLMPLVGITEKADETTAKIISADQIIYHKICGSWTFSYADGVTVCVRFCEDGTFHDNQNFRTSWSTEGTQLIIGGMIFDFFIEDDFLVLRYDDVSLYLFQEPDAPIGRWVETVSDCEESDVLWIFEDGTCANSDGRCGIWYLLDEALVMEWGNVTDAFYYVLSDDALVLMDFYTNHPMWFYTRTSYDYPVISTLSKSDERDVAAWYQSAIEWVALYGDIFVEN